MAYGPGKITYFLISLNVEMSPGECHRPEILSFQRLLNVGVSQLKCNRKIGREDFFKYRIKGDLQAWVLGLA